MKKQLTNEEKVLLEDELWQLEVVLDNPEFSTRQELASTKKRIAEIKKILTENKG